MAQTSATINQRKDYQQDRIAQGIRSGELTAGETRNLESREASVNREEYFMRRADDGRSHRRRFAPPSTAPEPRLQLHLSRQAQRLGPVTSLLRLRTNPGAAQRNRVAPGLDCETRESRVARRLHASTTNG